MKLLLGLMFSRSAAHKLLISNCRWTVIVVLKDCSVLVIYCLYTIYACMTDCTAVWACACFAEY